MTTGKVTIILTSYNRPDVVGRAIKSALEQTYTNLELYVMDDNSTEETVEAIYDAVGEDERVVVYHSEVDERYREKTCRYAVLINAAIEMSDGEFITYLTDDDYYFPERLEKFVDAIRICDVVYGPQLVIQGNRQWIRHTVGRTFSPMNRVDHNSFMHRRAALQHMNKPYWPEEPEFWGHCDAAFFTKLVQMYEFFPVLSFEPLDAHTLHANSVQGRMMLGLGPV